MKAFITGLILVLALQETHGQTSISMFPKDGSWVKIHVVQTGQCLAVENAASDNGARIVQVNYTDKPSQKFQVKKNDDGTFSFFAGHSGKTICADKGDNREGDLIVQNTLSAYFGKWFLTKLENCGLGWKISYKNGSGKPLQVSSTAEGADCRLIEPIYQDGQVDCPYNYVFEPIDPPAPVLLKEKSHLPVKPAVIRKNQQ
ncbi:MAG: hypothetical protein EOO09_00390 [Chitinophagaceae bacterium]|nr:MAG: hypothetical protein EOO09_00390 [Chitinophagaceae bacterium]